MTSTPRRSKTPDSQTQRRSASMANISLTRKEDWQRFVTAPARTQPTAPPSPPPATPPARSSAACA